MSLIWLVAGVCFSRRSKMADGDGLNQQLHQTEKKEKKELIFSLGTTLKNRWTIDCLIAEGGFGQIYKALDISDRYNPVAVKAEAVNAPLPLLRMELSVLNDLQKTHSVHFLRFHGCGTTLTGHFIVMDLAGKSMMDVKKSTPNDRLSPGSSLRLGCQMLTALRQLHDIGWLHRDVKPSNFCLGRHPSTRKTLYLIDFGLCRKYVDGHWKIKPPRSQCGFRGTLRYASVNIHQGKDMGRFDDIWSVFYILLEQILGQIPWRRLNDKPKVLKLKVETDFGDLLGRCPPSLNTMKKQLDTLDYYSEPDYDALIKEMQRDLHILHIRDKDPMDWETPIGASELSMKIPGTPCPSIVDGPSQKT